MLLVKTKVGPSKIHGLGLFAAEFIPAGTVIWKYHELDRKYSTEELAQLPALARQIIEHYCYHSDIDGSYVLCFDDARFFNHSSQPNVKSVSLPTEPEGMEIALRDIADGEELLCDCREFDLDCANGLETYVEKYEI